MSAREDANLTFDPKSVCWGYRDLFERTIRGLLDEGAIGPERREVTGKFYEMLRHADQGCYDHVLKEFLASLNPRTRWLLDLPGIFSDVVDLGWEFSRRRLHYGIRYFEALGAGGFGDTPARVRLLLRYLRRLRQVDDDLAMAFLRGYPRLIERLRPDEVEFYVRAGLEIYRRNKQSGLAFMEGTLKTSEQYILSITKECRLEDARDSLAALLHALTGRGVEVADLGRLDSDERIERGSTVVMLADWLYLPHRVRDFDSARLNRTWYTLAAVAAAGAVDAGSFPRIHGHPRYETCMNVVGRDTRRLNLFQIVEWVRTLRWVRRRWPGARRLMDWGLRIERENAPPRSAVGQLFHDAAAAEPTGGAGRLIAKQADASANLLDTAGRLDEPWAERVAEVVPGLATVPLPPVSFLPDFLFPGTLHAPPRDSLIADLKQQARPRAMDDGAEDQAAAAHTPADGVVSAEEEEAEAAGPRAAYVYDEWSQDENDYYRDHCLVYEKRKEAQADASAPENVMAEARKVAQAFERLRPELTRKEKRLREGEAINPDLLLEYMIDRRREPSPRIRFYEKPRPRRRDLAAIILLDASGSTGEDLGEPRLVRGGDPPGIARAKRIIDVEKHAALILGQGLASLGDRFAICGFSSNGRENCLFQVYKDFKDEWGRPPMRRILAATPANSTRIGPALRHAGRRLEQQDSRQRLIVLVTDGRPMDSGYDPNTRYAQHDVRMACEENERKSIHTLGISTDQNSVADMEIMFPQRRFVILPDLRSLPQVLPKLYVKLTA